MCLFSTLASGRRLSQGAYKKESQTHLHYKLHHNYSWTKSLGVLFPSMVQSFHLCMSYVFQTPFKKNILPIFVMITPSNRRYFTRQPFYFNISEFQSIPTVKQIFQFCLHAVYLLVLVFKHASLYN